jgi:hypothetical protein
MRHHPDQVGKFCVFGRCGLAVVGSWIEQVVGQSRGSSSVLHCWLRLQLPHGFEQRCRFLRCCSSQHTVTVAAAAGGLLPRSVAPTGACGTLHTTWEASWHQSLWVSGLYKKQQQQQHWQQHW